MECHIYLVLVKKHTFIVCLRLNLLTSCVVKPPMQGSRKPDGGKIMFAIGADVGIVSLILGVKREALNQLVSNTFRKTVRR